MAGFPWRVVDDLKRFLADAEPERCSVTDAVAVLKACAELERLAAGGRILFSARAAESPAWMASGRATPVQWLADQTGAESKEAAAALETSKRLERLPRTEKTLRSGSVAPELLHLVARAAHKDPSSEAELVGLARRGDRGRVKERARQVMAQAASAEEEQARYRRLHERRYCRTFSDAEGAFRLDARLAPDVGARMLSALQAEADMVFATAREQGVRESSGAYLADALVNLTTGSSRGGKKPGQGGIDTLVIRVDAEALRRGHVGSGETCEVAGVGPVPVATARRLLGEGFLKILVKKGVDVTTVCHVGRTVPAHLQSALDERDPICVVPGCGTARGLENHHWAEDFATCRTATLANLARVCRRHHDLISYDGYRLFGGPGAWRFAPPADIGHELLDTG